MTSGGTGFGAIIRMQIRTGWLAAAIWIAALGGGYAATVAAVNDLYDTPEKLAGYEVLTEDPAMSAINGTAYGADTLGGVAANEYGFVIALAVPLMGLLLVNRHTRAQEERGLLELLRSRRVGARAPWSAAVLLTAADLAVLGAILAATLIGFGEPVDAALVYGAGVALLGIVFAGVAAFVGQLVRRASTVTGIGIVLLGAAYATRAIGDVRDTGWKWLSPLAWQQEPRPFTDELRLWPLGLSLLVAALLIGAGLVLAGRRDLGAALFGSRRGPVRAGRMLRTTLGVAVQDAAGSGAAWVAGTFAVAAVFGAFTEDIADVLAGNPDLAGFLGGGDSAEQAYLAFCLITAVVMALGCLGQGISRLRAEETGGRLEPTLARQVSRTGWLAAHAGVATAVAAVAVIAGGLGLSWTGGSAGEGLVFASTAYLPVVLVVAAFGVALFGLLPRAGVALWAVFGYILLVAFLGDVLSLPDWAMSISPMSAIGQVPVDDVSAAAEWTLVAVAAVLAAAGFIGFRKRDIPR
ncbi:ABC transporter permease [Microbacterium halophytorum]|uniref:ABC transporter permease n=1 Tax=Microbacterium halophytorum TaxID=2067568 RepID=UPI000CFE129C|nr:hypothetical protein [Microbacterium halophytorum]